MVASSTTRSGVWVFEVVECSATGRHSGHGVSVGGQQHIEDGALPWAMVSEKAACGLGEVGEVVPGAMQDHKSISRSTSPRGTTVQRTRAGKMRL